MRQFVLNKKTSRTLKGEKFETILRNAIKLGGYATYTRPKVKYHSDDMFGGDVLWCYNGEVVVVQAKRYKENSKGLYEGRKAFLDHYADAKQPIRYLVVVRSDKDDFTVMAQPNMIEVAIKLCNLFGGGIVLVYDEKTKTFNELKE